MGAAFLLANNEVWCGRRRIGREAAFVSRMLMGQLFVFRGIGTGEKSRDRTSQRIL
jgi:hypothetical protein